MVFIVGYTKSGRNKDDERLILAAASEYENTTDQKYANDYIYISF